jgi:WhiB family redox-sensing transcriptional regulator
MRWYGHRPRRLSAGPAPADTDQLEASEASEKEGSVLSFTDSSEKLDWQDRAACREYDNVLFFGEEGESELEKQAREARAKAVCQRCPVSEPCLEFAMDTNQKYGIWGGLTDKERASLKRRRARARRAS